MYIVYIAAHLKPVVEMQFKKRGHTKKNLKIQEITCYLERREEHFVTVQSLWSCITSFISCDVSF
jgi:hypothetical protein